VLVEAGPELFSMFKPNLRAYTVEALNKRTVEVMTGERVASVSPTRVTLQSGKVLEAHTLVWGAGLSGNQLVQSLGLELERGTASASARSSISRIIPRSTSSGTSPRSRMEGRNRCSLSSGPLPCSRDTMWAR
jgi:Pyridine nucleotide-disulphide oxidoreductase